MIVRAFLCDMGATLELTGGFFNEKSGGELPLTFWLESYCPFCLENHCVQILADISNYFPHR